MTLAPQWPDPAETEAFNTPFMVLSAVMGEAVVGNLQTVGIHQIQTVMTRVGESTAGAIPGYPYTAPMEDLTLET